MPVCSAAMTVPALVVGGATVRGRVEASVLVGRGVVVLVNPGVVVVVGRGAIVVVVTGPAVLVVVGAGVAMGVVVNLA